MSRKSAAPKPASSDAALLELRAFGLAYPNAHTKSPWPGHLDLAVNDKTFAYLSLEGEPFSIGCKLPHSCAMALNLPGTQPTPYGLGKSGWVSATPPEGKPIPVDLFKAWIDESYRAQAPKRLVKLLPPSASGAVENAGGAVAAGRVARKADVRKADVRKADVRRVDTRMLTTTARKQTASAPSRKQASATPRSGGKPSIRKKGAP